MNAFGNLSSSPAVHRTKAAGWVKYTRESVWLARRDIENGRCREALFHMLSAAYSSGAAFADTDGAGDYHAGAESMRNKMFHGLMYEYIDACGRKGK